MWFAALKPLHKQHGLYHPTSLQMVSVCIDLKKKVLKRRALGHSRVLNAIDWREKKNVNGPEDIEDLE